MQDQIQTPTEAAELAAKIAYARAAYTEAAQNAYIKAEAAQNAYVEYMEAIEKVCNIARDLEKGRYYVGEDWLVLAKKEAAYCKAYYECAVKAAVETAEVAQKAFIEAQYS